MTTYAKHDTLPAYELAVWGTDGSAKPLNKGGALPLWGGKVEPPAIGTKIQVLMNSLGPATVKGYFTEEGYLGLLVQFHKPPKWWMEQNKNQPGPRLGHIFGPEFRLS